MDNNQNEAHRVQLGSCTTSHICLEWVVESRRLGLAVAPKPRRLVARGHSMGRPRGQQDGGHGRHHRMQDGRRRNARSHISGILFVHFAGHLVKIGQQQPALVTGTVTVAAPGSSTSEEGGDGPFFCQNERIYQYSVVHQLVVVLFIVL